VSIPERPPLLPYLRGLARDAAGGGAAAYRAREIPPLDDPPPGTLMATFLGTAGFLLDDGETQLLIDPFVSCPTLPHVAVNKPIQPDRAAIAAWVDRLEARRVAAVMVTHSHYDHAMDAPAFAELCDAPLLGSSSTAMIGRGSGLPAQRTAVVSPGSMHRFGAFEVHFLPSVHGPCPIGDPPHRGHVTEPLVPPAHHAAWKHGDVWVLWVRHPQGSFIHQGTADTLPETLQGVQADLAMSCLVWRRSTQDVLERTVDAVGATRLIPLHADDMFRRPSAGFSPMPGVDLAGFFADMARLRPDLPIDTLPLGEARPLFPPRRVQPVSPR
jgi:L-ascorbate metabolism protein UlaG (beta-lactamase superfamily)